MNDHANIKPLAAHRVARAGSRSLRPSRASMRGDRIGFAVLK
jgi:hypothetical protein